MISPDTKKTIHLLLLVAIVAATVRAGYIFYQRHQDRLAAERKQREQNIGYSNPDYYVNPKKLYPYDLKSAKQLAQQPVWVKEGYRYTYYPYDPARKRVDWDHEAGLLLPIEKLDVKDVVRVAPPKKEDRRQVVAVFDKDGKNYAVPVGFETEDQYTIYSDEMFYVQDPHELYKHWPADVWQAVDRHEIKPGMNELQVAFALGMGTPDSGDVTYSKTVHYPNGGKPLVVVYHEGKAAEIKPGA